MNSKSLVLAVAGFLAASMPLTATADILEVTFSGTIAEGSGDLTNVFGFGTGNALDGRAAIGVLRINLSTAPPGILNNPSAGMNYWDADAMQRGWKIPGYSWIESSLSIEGHAAPDLVKGTANYANADISVVNEGGTADHWLGQDWATTVLYPEEGKGITYEDLLEIQLYNADFLSGFDLNQQFTMSGGPDNSIGVGTFRYTDMDSTALDPYQISAHGYINITSVTAKLLKGSYDFNGDGKPDILWRYKGTGENYVWYMDGMTVLGGASLPTVEDQSWNIVGVEDFNNDGKPDILWRNTAGYNYIWYLDGVTVLGGASLPTVEDQSWNIVGVEDLNNDNRPDILWRNTAGNNYVWYLDGETVLGGGNLPMVADQNWKVVGVADFNNDNKPDMLWRSTAGYNYVWYLDGVTVLGGASLPRVEDQSWNIVGVKDFNNDGNPDILWRNTAGYNYVWYLDGVTVLGGGNLPTVADQNWTILP